MTSTKVEFKPVKWQVSKQVQSRGPGKTKYIFCRCECGVENWVRASSLFVDSFSCKRCSNSQRTHGLVDTPVYNAWNGMRQRCHYTKHIGYKTYGGRGIQVCDEWRASFEAFRDWSFQNGYGPGLSIDRIDNDKNYEPTNCRWVSQHVQSRNQSRNINIEIDGRKMILKDWCKELERNYGTALDRIKKGMSPKDALLEPSRQGRRPAKKGKT